MLVRANLLISGIPVLCLSAAAIGGISHLNTSKLLNNSALGFFRSSDSIHKMLWVPVLEPTLLRKPASFGMVPQRGKQEVEAYLLRIPSTRAGTALKRLVLSGLDSSMPTTVQLEVDKRAVSDLKQDPEEAARLIRDALRSAPIPAEDDGALLRINLLLALESLPGQRQNSLEAAQEELNTSPAGVALHAGDLRSSQKARRLLLMAHQIVLNRARSDGERIDVTIDAIHRHENLALRKALTEALLTNRPKLKTEFQSRLRDEKLSGLNGPNGLSVEETHIAD